MSNVDKALEDKVIKILNKDTLTKEDIFWLRFYFNRNKPTSVDRLTKDGKSIVSLINKLPIGLLLGGGGKVE